MISIAGDLNGHLCAKSMRYESIHGGFVGDNNMIWEDIFEFKRTQDSSMYF